MSKLNPNRRQFAAQSLTAAGAVLLRPERILGANERVRLAVIGCGERGRALLREVLTFRLEENVDVLAVCDTWRQQREKAAAMVREATAQEPRQLVHYEQVMAAKDIDAVIIATPDHQHCTQLIAAATAGKDAYIEKPLAMDMKELQQAVDAVRKNARVVQCGTQVRSFASSVAARAFVASGGLGAIFKVEQSRNSYRPYWHSYGERPIQESDVDWKAFLLHRAHRPWNPDQYTTWYGYREFSRGPHTSLLVHFIDLVHYVTGASVPRRVIALGGTYRWKDSRDAPDSIEVMLDYGDFLVRYNSTFGTKANSFLRFFGTRGMMDATRWSEPFMLSGEGSEEPDRLRPGAQIPVIESVPHMPNWLQCIRTRQAPHAPIEAGYAHSVACIMADEAYTRGKRMTYDPAKREIHEG